VTTGSSRLLIRGGTVIESGRSEPRTADVLVDGAMIAAVDARVDVGDDDPTEILDAAGHLVMPGLINAHTHGRENLIKGIVDNRPLEAWLHEVAVHSQQRTPREQYISVALGAVEALRSGTTSIYELFTAIPVITVESVVAALDAYRDVGLRAIVAPSISDLPYYATIPGLRSRLTPQLAHELAELFPAHPGVDQLDIVAAAASARPRDPLVRMGVAPVIPERCSDDFLQHAFALADSMALPTHLHLAETRIQVEERFRRSGHTPTRHLAGLGLLGPSVTLAHAIWVDDWDIAALATSGATVVHNPVSNMKLGSGVMPLRALLDAGVPVAVGTDGSASSDHQNMFEALRIATYMHRMGEPDWERWPTAHEVLTTAWEAGARAMGRAGRLGRVEPGCLADITILDCDVESLTPLNDPRNQVVMCETGAAVRHVVIDGKVVLRDGEPARIDAAGVRAEAREAARRLGDSSHDRAHVIAEVIPQIRAARLERT
jgi:5-methylthioadenosine/S-adenosylhomocysteine deaminase